MIYQFMIDTDDTGTIAKYQQACLGDRLTITKTGSLRIYLRGVLVGAAKADRWSRVVLDRIDPITLDTDSR